MYEYISLYRYGQITGKNRPYSRGSQSISKKSNQILPCWPWLSIQKLEEGTFKNNPTCRLEQSYFPPTLRQISNNELFGLRKIFRCKHKIQDTLRRPL